MKNVIIYGAGLYGKNAIKSIENYPEIQLLGIYDSQKKGTQFGLAYIDLSQEVLNFEDTIIVICIANAKEVLKVYSQLKKWGYKKIYKYMNKTKCYGKDFLRDECIDCGENLENELIQIEVHMADHCNLNCRGCAHFSPLFDEEYPDLDECRNDIKALKQRVGGIKILNLLGGEPLLNKNLADYIKMYREELPDTLIQIVTNGLLIPKLDESLMRCIAQNHIVVSVSEYAPTKKIISKICERLQEYEIDYSIREYDRKQTFSIPYTVNKDSKRTRKCISAGCVNVWKGKISACPALMYVKRFNERFECDLPTKGIIDLKTTELEKEELVQAIYSPVPLCNYCVEGEIDWTICGRTPQKSDFAWED